MLSRAVQRCGSSSLHNRRGLSPNSSRETPIAAAETREGRGQKAHALGRVLSNSSKLRNVKAGKVAGRVVSNAKVVSSVKNAKSALSFLTSQEGWPSGHLFLCNPNIR
jgi:hypothetical protein